MLFSFYLHTYSRYGTTSWVNVYVYFERRTNKVSTNVASLCHIVNLSPVNLETIIDNLSS